MSISLVNVTAIAFNSHIITSVLNTCTTPRSSTHSITMGKGGEKAVASGEQNMEVLIDGRFYDVSKMKHPGGSVIKFYAGKGIDATQAFDNFHIRSKKAKKILEHLPSRAAEKNEMEKNLLPGQASLLEDFNQLTRDRKFTAAFLSSTLVVCPLTFILTLFRTL